MTKINVTYHPGMYQPPSGRPCLHSTRDAAAHLGCTRSSVRRQLRTLGVRCGVRVAGMVEIAAGGRTGFIPVSSR